MAGEVGEVVGAEHVVESPLAGPDTVKEVTPGTVLLLGVHDCQGAHGGGVLALQELGHWREGERAASGLGEYACTRERPQYSIEGLGVAARRPGKLLASLRSVREQVGDAQLGRNVDSLRHPVTRHHLEQCDRRRRIRRLHFRLCLAALVCAHRLPLPFSSQHSDSSSSALGARYSRNIRETTNS